MHRGNSSVINLYHCLLEPSENQIPCRKFELSSNGPIKPYSSEKLGVYVLSDAVFNNRLVYEKDTNNEAMGMFFWGYGEDSAWVVSKEI